MPRDIRWSDLKIGVLTFVGIALIVTAVLVFARVGALRGKTTTLYVVTNEASEVIQGTEVWLGGQKVGVVDRVDFRAASTDTSERLAIKMSILSQYLRHIRRDSDVQIRPGGNLIGDPVVYITIGTNRAAHVVANDTLRARAQQMGDRRPLTRTFGSLGDSVGTVLKSARRVLEQGRTAGGRVAHIFDRAKHQASDVSRAATQISARVRGSGTIGAWLHDRSVHDAVESLSAQTDSIRLLLANPHGDVGRFRRDSTLVTTIARLHATADTVRTRIGHPLARADSMLVRQLDLVRVQLDSLSADVRRHPFKYLKSL